jgi:hypothetical protein
VRDHIFQRQRDRNRPAIGWIDNHTSRPGFNYTRNTLGIDRNPTPFLRGYWREDWIFWRCALSMLPADEPKSLDDPQADD